MKKAAALVVGACMLFVGGALAFSIPLRIFLGLDESGNTQLIAFAKTLNSTSTKKGIRSRLASYPLLRYSEAFEPLGWVGTPGRWDVQNWVAFLEYRPDGTLLAVGYGTVDFAPIKSRGKDSAWKGLPENACWGDALECETSWVRRNEAY